MHVDEATWERLDQPAFVYAFIPLLIMYFAVSKALPEAELVQRMRLM
jgi:hypothetical protein